MLTQLPCRLLSANPLVAVADGFLDADRCAGLIEVARDQLAPAAVGTDAANATQSEDRTNSDCFLKAAEVPEAAALLAQLAPMVGLPVAHAEDLSVLHYAPGQQFKLHVDGIWSGADPDSIQAFNAEGGQRLFTTMVYLNDVGGGGGTAFPQLDLRVGPSQGRLLIFANTPAGDPDQSPRAGHIGEAVTDGEKWVAVTWWRAQPYTRT
ncbi:MAG: 2OG-Fe(II) oxygenase [Pseudomonadota bacterium]